MSKSKPKKSTAFSRFLIASIICGTAFGFTGRAYAEDPVQPGGEALYLANANSISANVFAAGSKAYGVYANGAGKTIGFTGEAISLGVTHVDSYGLIGFFAKDVGTEEAKAITLGSDTKTNFVVINATGDDSTHVRGMRVKNSIVNVKGVYFGMYASTGAKDDVYGVETKTGGIVNLSSENSVISVTGGSAADDAIGLYANVGTITVKGNLYVNASTAISADEGTVTTDANKQTVLNGNISATTSTGTINANLTGKNSSWTGNVTDSTGTINVDLINGATWTPTTLTTTAAVDTLTMGGTAGGFIEMRDNQGGGTAATANVGTITGNGTAHMDVNDTLEVGTISNSGLTVFGGKLYAGTIKSDATVALDGVNVIDNLIVNGVLNGKNVVFADNTKLTVGYETDATTSGSATFTGDTTTVYDVVVAGGTLAGDPDPVVKTGSATFNATQTYAHSLKANKYGSIVANGNLTTKRNITADGGAIDLNGATKVGGYDGIAAGSSDLVAKNNGTITVTGDLTADDIKVSGTNSKVTINKNGGATVKLGGADRSGTPASGDIEMNGGTVNINLDNGASSWYGNVSASAGDLDVALSNGAKWTGNVTTNNGDMALTLANGATWNATKLDTVAAVTTLTMNDGVVSMKNQTAEAATDAQEAATAKVGTLTGSKATVNMDSNDTLVVGAIGKTGETLDLTVNGGQFKTITVEGKATTVQGIVHADFFGTNITGDGLTVAGTLNANNAYVTADKLDVKGILNANNSVVTTVVNVGDGTAAGTTTFGGFMSNVQTLNAEGKDADNKSTVKFDAIQNTVGTMTADANSTITANGNLMAQKVVAKDGGIVALNGGFTSVWNDTTDGVGLEATGTTGGTITVNSNLFVNAATAVKTDKGGHIEINWEGDTPNKNVTVLNGNLDAVNAPLTIKAQLTGSNSSWTGNVAHNTNSNIEFRLYDGAKWNVNSDAIGVVNTLTMGATDDTVGGIISMTEEGDGKTAKTAKVVTLAGTKGTVNMDGVDTTADTLEVSYFDVDDLTINGGVLKVVDVTGVTTDRTINAGDKLTLVGTMITGDGLTVNGKLIGINVTAGAGITADKGLVVLKGDADASVANVNSLTAQGDADNEGKIIIAAADIDATSLTADANGIIVVKGGSASNATITGDVTANGGTITLDSAATTVGGLSVSGNDGFIDVTSDFTASKDGDVISVTGGYLGVNTDGKHKTILTGNIKTSGGATAIVLTGGSTADDVSSWTGNRTGTAGSVDITMGKNVTWNVTTDTNATAVDILTVNGGTIDLKDTVVTEDSTDAKDGAVAKVSTLLGTSAVVNMDSYAAAVGGTSREIKADTFAIGTNTNKNLTINGGKLDEAVDDAGITNAGVINLKNVTVDAAVNGTGIINVIGGTSGAANANTVTANGKIANKINVATQYDTLSIDADYVGNKIVNAGTVVLTADAKNATNPNTLTNKIIGGNVSIGDGDTSMEVTADVSKLVGNDVTVKNKGTLTLTGGSANDYAVLQANKLDINGTDVDNHGTVIVGDGVADVYVDMKADQLGTFGTGAQFKVNAHANLNFYGDLSKNITNDGTAKVYGDLKSGDFTSNGTTTIYGDVEGKIGTTNTGNVTVYGDIGSGNAMINGGTLNIEGGDVNRQINNSGIVNFNGDLNANIICGGSTNLTGDIKVTKDFSIGYLDENGNPLTTGGTLVGNSKTIDMTDGSTNTLTVGGLSGNANLKIDVDLSTPGSADVVKIGAGATGGTITLTSVNITADALGSSSQRTFATNSDGSTLSNATAIVNTLKVGTVSGSGYDTQIYDISQYNPGSAINGTMQIVMAEKADTAGSSTSEVTEYRATIKQMLENHQETRSGYTGNWTTWSQTDGIFNAISLVGDASLSADANVAGSKDIYLNGHTLQSTSPTVERTINVATSSQEVNLSGGTTSAMINWSVSNNATLNIDKVAINGDITNNGGKVTVEDSTIAKTGVVTNTTGTMDFIGDNTVDATVTNGGTVTFKGDSDVTNNIINSGKMTFTGDTQIGDDNGYYVIAGGGVAVDVIVNGGTMEFTGDTTVNSSVYENKGTMTFTGTTAMNNEINNKKNMSFNGVTEVNDTILNSGTMTFDGFNNFTSAITNNNVLNVSGNTTTDTNAIITGDGKLTIDGIMDAGASITQLLGVELTDGSTLKIVANKLQSTVTNGETSTVVLGAGTLTNGKTISNGNIVLNGNIIANADDLASKTLDIGTNTLTLNGGNLDGYNNNGITIIGNVGANIVVAGAVSANANDLTVDVSINGANNSLTLYGGTLADGVKITANPSQGKLIIDSNSGVTARVQDIGVNNGIENKQNFTLKGEGELSSSISGNGWLTVAGKVDAGDFNQIAQGKLTVNDGAELHVGSTNLIVSQNYVYNNGNLYLTGSGKIDEKITGTGTTHIGDGDNTILDLDAGMLLDNKLVVERNAKLNLNTIYTNTTAMVNAGILNVDVVNLKADVDNYKFYAVEHDVDELVQGTVNLNGEGTLTNKVAYGTLNVNGNISANADNVAAVNTYVADDKTLTLTGGTLLGVIASVNNYEGTVVINGDVVAKDAIELATTVNAGKSLEIDADNVKADVILNNATKGDQHGQLVLCGGTLSNTVTGGRILLKGDVSTEGSKLDNNNFIRLNEKVLTITGGDLNVAIGNKDCNGGTLKFTGTTASTKDIYTNIEVAAGGNLTANVKNIKQTDKATKNIIENNGVLNLNGGVAYKAAEGDTPAVEEKADAIGRAISGTGYTNIDGILTTENAITQGVVNIGKGKSLIMKGANADLTATYAVVNAGNLTVDGDNLDAVVANSGTMNLGAGTINKMITGVWTGDAMELGTTNITGNVTSNAAIYQKTVNIEKNNTLTMNDVLTADVNIANGAVLAIDANNLNGNVDIVVGIGDQRAKNGTVALGAGVLTKKINKANIQLTDNVKTSAANLVGNKLVDLNNKVLIVDGGELAVAIGANANHTGLLVTEGTTTIGKAVYTDLANIGNLTANVTDIKQIEADGVAAKIIANDGTLNLKGADAEPTSEEDAIYLQRAIIGNGTTNFTGHTSTKNTVAQAVVDIAANASLGFVEDANLIATDKITNKGTLGIDAEHLMGAVENTGSLKLGSNKAVETPAVEELNFAISGDGAIEILGLVKSNKDINQKTVNVTDGNTLTMANDAKLTATEGIKVEQNAVLTVAAADLNGNVTLAKGVPTTEQPDNVNGKLILGTGVLNNTITGGDVVLNGDVKTVGGNLISNELVKLDSNYLIISSGNLDVAIGSKDATTGLLQIEGTTTANNDVYTGVVVAATGVMSVGADKLKTADVANTVTNYGALTLTGGTTKEDPEEGTVIEIVTLGKAVVGTGNLTINGLVDAESNVIQQNNVTISAGSYLHTDAQLLAHVDIAAAGLGKDAGSLTIGASNLQGAVTNNGDLTLYEGTFTGLDESYTGFVASINGEGTTNIKATAEGTVVSNQVIKQKYVNVESGTFDMNSKLTATGKTTVDSGATMNIAAANIKGYVDNAGTINLEAGILNVDLTDTTSVVENVANSGVIYVPNGTTIDSIITNTGTVYTDGTVTMNAAINGSGENPEEHGWLVVRTGTTTFANTTAGSLNTNVEIKEGATLDPLARTFAGDILVNDYGTLKVDGTDPYTSDGNENKLAATINVKDKGLMELTNGYIVLNGGTINQEVSTTLQATGNVATTPVIQGVNSVDQLNVGGSILKLTGEVTGIAKEQQYALVQGKAVKEVVAQDLLLNKKLWRTVEMTGEDAKGNPVTVSNDNPNANFVTDYFLSNDGTAIVAEVRTIKTIDEVNTNGLAGVQQGALAMTNQMNDRVAENMSLVERPAVEKGKKYDKQIWASYINTKEDVEERELWNMKADNTAKYSGAMVGVDFYSSQKAIAGLALSYATGDITANTANRTHVQNDAKYYGVTLYDRVTNGNVAWTYDLGYQNGKNEISMNARENITADVKTNAYTAGIRVEGAIEAGKNSVFAPFASVRYTRLNTGDYTNSNGSKFDSNSQNFFIPKVGVAWKGDFGDSVKGWAFNPILEIGYMFNAGSRNVETQYLSSTGHMFNSEYDVVDSGTYYGRVGMNFVNRNFSFGLNYRYLKGSTTKNNRWNVNLGYKF